MLFDNVPARGQLEFEGADLFEQVADNVEGALSSPWRQLMVAAPAATVCVDLGRPWRPRPEQAGDVIVRNGSGGGSGTSDIHAERALRRRRGVTHGDVRGWRRDDPKLLPQVPRFILESKTSSQLGTS